MEKSAQTNLQRIIGMAKDWWWVATLVVSAILVWGTMPSRMAKAEQKNDRQDQEIIDLKRLSSKMDGYISSNQETNKLLMNLQQQKQTPRQQGLREWDDATQTMWCCDLSDRQACFQQQRWWVCQ